MFIKRLRASHGWFFAVAGCFLATGAAQAQETDSEQEETLEEIVVVGSQIRGASISDALAVTVIDAEAIEFLGVESGDELLDLIPENGQNFVNEAENISGGVNAARGDIGAYNLRNLGTGNTLVLLNGRRMVNAAGFQTEEVGGSFVPVNSVNSNAIPVAGMARVEVLRDGASAIYGADAVAGVVNHVLKNDFQGLTISGRYSAYDHLPRDDQSLTIEWGKDFNDGRTNVSVFANYYTRDRVRASDEARWANSDFRSRIPEGSPWEGDTRFRNNSANSNFGQFDVIPSVSGTSLRNNVTDTSGEFETYPTGDSRCQYQINAGVCGAIDGQGTFRRNLNETRDIVSELDRMSIFGFINHEFANGIESFTEISLYHSDTNLNRHSTAPFSSVRLEMAADAYYNPFGPVGSPNRLPDSVIGTNVPAGGVAILLDNYRFTEVPRVVDNSGDYYRFLQGFRGSKGDWDWEGAVVISEAEKEDITRNRVSNTLIQAALNDTTSAGYNPFSADPANSNIEQALVDVRRDGKTSLYSADFKMSTNELFELPAGPVGFLAGVEFRREEFVDDRDPRLDGTIAFVDRDGDTFPFVSDAVNSSPTPDSSGDRDVSSIFAELQIPLHSTLDVQAAVRFEDYSDVGNTTVGKLAAGWRPFDFILLRGSWSEAFRAPNLITINEDIVARNNTRTDFACLYAAEFGGDPNQDTLDCRNSIQRIARGSQELQPELSTNTSVGFVFSPIEQVRITADWWSIEKEDTIGLFGEENHTLLDLLLRRENGLNNCATFQGNSAIERLAPDPDEEPFYTAAGICNAGPIDRINDQYANLDKRTVEGLDVGVYVDLETRLGDFSLRWNGSFIDKFEQEAGGAAAQLVAAVADGTIPVSFPVDGFADLIGRDGNQDKRISTTVSWRKGDLGASVSGYRIGSFYQSSLTLGDGTRYEIPSMTTYNATFSYYADDLFGTDARFRLGVKNFTDERAPLADRFFGYFADAHRDLGVSYYLDARFKFGQ